MEEDNSKQVLFETLPVPKAVAKMCVPGIFSMVVTTIYGIADTYFVSTLNDPVQVAAVSLASAALYLNAAVSSLFGAGGSSYFSRALGRKDYDTAREVSSTSIWCAAFCGILISILYLLLKTPMVKLLGADNQTASTVMDYLRWTLMYGAVPSILNVVMSRLIAAEGYSAHASVGVMSGCILNCILDPFFILPQFLGMGAAGAGLATMISNCIATAYFIIFILVKRKVAFTDFRLKYLSFDKNLHRGILTIGVPALIQSLTFFINSSVRNNILSKYGATILAAYGIAYKISMVPVSIVVGTSTGMLPLIGYNYAAGNYDRMKAVYSFTLKILLLASAVFLTAIYAVAPGLMHIFIDDVQVIGHGTTFLRISSITLILMSLDFMCVGVFQACGKGKQALAVALGRKVIEIPAMLLLDRLFSPYGMAAGEPVSELLIGLTMFFLVRRFFLKQTEDLTTTPVS